MEKLQYFKVSVSADFLSLKQGVHWNGMKTWFEMELGKHKECPTSSNRTIFCLVDGEVINMK